MRKNKLARRIEQKFSWDVSGLGTYVDEQSDEIIPALIYDGRTAQIVPIMEGVIGSKEIKLIDSSITLQDASSCGRNALGTTTLTDKAMVVKPIKSNQNFCSEDLVDTWGQLGLPNGVRNQRETLPYEDIIIAHQMNKILELNEDLIWKGNLGSATPNLNKIDGFKKKFDADATVTQINTAPIAAITAANVISVLQSVRNGLKVPVLSRDHAIFVGKETFDLYLTAVTNANLFHYNPVNDNMSITLHGTTTTIQLVHGLNGTSSIYAGPLDRMWIGTDLSSDWEDFSVYYSQENDSIYADVKYRLGVEFVYGSEFVKWTLAAS